jgi:hypothetical protein
VTNNTWHCCAFDPTKDRLVLWRIARLQENAK